MFTVGKDVNPKSHTKSKFVRNTCTEYKSKSTSETE